MNDEQLEELVRATLERDAARVPLTRPEWDPALPLPPIEVAASGGARRAKLARPLMAVAGVLLVIVAGVAVFNAGSDQDLMVGSAPPDGDLNLPTTTMITGATTTTVVVSTDTTSPGPPFPTSTTIDGMPPVTTIAPPVTLPEAVDVQGVPATVPGAPTAYYRFAPDLDLAWSDRDGNPELCWRTPIDEQCVAHPAPTDSTSTIVIPSSSEHALVLVFSGPGRFGGPSAIEVGLNGSQVTPVPVAWPDPQLDIGVARVSAPSSAVTEVTVR